MNVVALPFDSGYASENTCRGHRCSSCSFNKSGGGWLNSHRDVPSVPQQANDPKDRRFDSSGKACRAAKTPF